MKKVLMFLSIFLMTKSEELVKLKKDSIFHFKDRSITFKKGMILPFVLKGELEPLEMFEGLGNISVPQNSIEKVEIDLNELNNLSFNDEESLLTFIKSVDKKRFRKEKNDFIYFIFFYNLCLKNISVNSEELEEKLFKFFFSNNKYLEILISFHEVEDIILFNSPLLLANLCEVENIIKKREDLFLKYDYSCSDLELKYLTIVLNSLVQRNAPNFKVLDTLTYFCSDRIGDLYAHTKKVRYLTFITKFIESLVSNDSDKVIEYVNGNYPKSFKKHLLIGYINYVYENRGEKEAIKIRNYIEEKLRDDIGKFILQFLPFNLFTSTTMDCSNFVVDNYSIESNIFLKDIKEKYRELMMLEEVNESNQFFKYMLDTYFLFNSLLYYQEGHDDKELIAFTAINSSFNKKEIYLNDILAMEDKFLFEVYSFALATRIHIEIDYIISSTLMYDKKFRQLLFSLEKTYENILLNTKLIDNEMFEMDLLLKKLAFNIFNLNDEVEEGKSRFEVCSEIYREILIKYPSNIDRADKYINRAIEVFKTLKEEEFEDKIATLKKEKEKRD